jgi:hypothetical protein
MTKNLYSVAPRSDLALPDRAAMNSAGRGISRIPRPTTIPIANASLLVLYAHTDMRASITSLEIRGVGAWPQQSMLQDFTDTTRRANEPALPPVVFILLVVFVLDSSPIRLIDRGYTVGRARTDRIWSKEPQVLSLSS